MGLTTSASDAGNEFLKELVKVGKADTAAFTGTTLGSAVTRVNENLGATYETIANTKAALGVTDYNSFLDSLITVGGAGTWGSDSRTIGNAVSKINSNLGSTYLPVSQFGNTSDVGKGTLSVDTADGTIAKSWA